MADVASSYDAVAAAYADAFADELDHKPLDRALIDCFAELVGTAGRVGDVGCGPGHVTRYLRDRGLDPIGVDLSPKMIEVATLRYPGVEFRVGSLTELGVPEGGWAGAVALYSLIHLAQPERAAAYRELAGAVRPGGWLLVGFHVSDAESGPGESRHVTEFRGIAVSLDFYLLDPDEATAGLEAAGFALQARVDRAPWEGVEHPSRRCYLLCRRTIPAPAGELS